VTDLRVISAEPLGVDIIEVLRRALEKAEAGELSSVAIAMVYRDGCTGASWSSAPSLALLLGSVARLSHILARKMDA
jgi:hypothetical protein